MLKLKDKITKLAQLSREVNDLRAEIICEIEAKYAESIKKRVKIPGQKGWCYGTLTSVKVNCIAKSGEPGVVCLITSENGHNSKKNIPFEKLEFLTEKEKKI